MPRNINVGFRIKSLFEWRVTIFNIHFAKYTFNAYTISASIDKKLSNQDHIKYHGTFLLKPSVMFYGILPAETEQLYQDFHEATNNLQSDFLRKLRRRVSRNTQKPSDMKKLFTEFILRNLDIIEFLSMFILHKTFAQNCYKLRMVQCGTAVGPSVNLVFILSLSHLP